MKLKIVLGSNVFAIIVFINYKTKFPLRSKEHTDHNSVQKIWLDSLNLCTVYSLGWGGRGGGEELTHTGKFYEKSVMLFVKTTMGISKFPS